MYGRCWPTKHGGLRVIWKEEKRDVCVQLSRTKLSLSWPTVESSGGSGSFCLEKRKYSKFCAYNSVDILS